MTPGREYDFFPHPLCWSNRVREAQKLIYPGGFNIFLSANSFLVASKFLNAPGLFILFLFPAHHAGGRKLGPRLTILQRLWAESDRKNSGEGAAMVLSRLPPQVPANIKQSRRSEALDRTCENNVRTWYKDEDREEGSRGSHATCLGDSASSWTALAGQSP